MSTAKASKRDIPGLPDAEFFREVQCQYLLLAEAIRRPEVLDRERAALTQAADELLRSAGIATLSVDGLARPSDKDLDGQASIQAIAEAHAGVVAAYAAIEGALAAVAERQHAAGKSSDALVIVGALLAARSDSPVAKALKTQIDADLAEAARKAEEERRAAEAARQAEEERQRREREAAEKKAKEEARRAKEAAEKAARLRSVHEMEFVRVAAGKFMMGQTGVALPEHEVELDSFDIAKFPITVAQFAAFVADSGYPADPSATREASTKGQHPVAHVSWHDAVAFCVWASEVTGWNLRLPTEAEWEKAARGTDGRWHPWGNSEPTPLMCNFGQQYGGTSPVGKFSPRGDSPYGAVDMAGNVWEWCADWYDEAYYGKSPSSNPQGPNSGQYRVLRGGSWFLSADFVRAASRHRDTPDYRSLNIGFRCARSQ